MSGSLQGICEETGPLGRLRGDGAGSCRRPKVRKRDRGSVLQPGLRIRLDGRICALDGVTTEGQRTQVAGGASGRGTWNRRGSRLFRCGAVCLRRREVGLCRHALLFPTEPGLRAGLGVLRSPERDWGEPGPNCDFLLFFSFAPVTIWEAELGIGYPRRKRISFISS